MVRRAALGLQALLAGCDCVASQLVLDGTVTAPVEPRVYLCSVVPDDEDPEEMDRCVPGTVVDAGEGAWTYAVDHSSAGDLTCFEPRYAVYVAEGCEQEVRDVEGVYEATLDVTLTCATAR